jgi:hypothetical protein
MHFIYQVPPLNETTINADYYNLNADTGDETDLVYSAYTHTMVMPAGEHEFYISESSSENTAKTVVWPLRGRKVKILVEQRQEQHGELSLKRLRNMDFCPRRTFESAPRHNWAPQICLYNTLQMKRKSTVLDDQFIKLWGESEVKDALLTLLKKFSTTGINSKILRAKKVRGATSRNILDFIPRYCISSATLLKDLQMTLRKNFAKLMDIFCFHCQIVVSNSRTQLIVSAATVQSLIEKMRYSTPNKLSVLWKVLQILGLENETELNCSQWIDVILVFIFYSTYGARQNEWEYFNAPPLASVVDAFLHHFLFPVCFAHNPNDFVQSILMDESTEALILDEVRVVVGVFLSWKSNLSLQFSRTRP